MSPQWNGTLRCPPKKTSSVFFSVRWSVTRRPSGSNPVQYNSTEGKMGLQYGSSCGLYAARVCLWKACLASSTSFRWRIARRFHSLSPLCRENQPPKKSSGGACYHRTLRLTAYMHSIQYIVPGTSIRSRSAMLPTGQLGNGFTSSERERKQRGRGYAREERGKGGPFRSSTLAVVGRMRKAHPTRYTKYDRHFGPPFSFFVRGIYPKKLFRLVGDPWPCIFGVVVSWIKGSYKLAS